MSWEIIDAFFFAENNYIKRVIVFDKLNKKLIGEIELTEDWTKTLKFYAENNYINLALTDEDKKRFPDKEIYFYKNYAIIFNKNLDINSRVKLIQTLQEKFNWGKKVEYRLFALIFDKYPLFLKFVDVNKIDEEGMVEWI